MKPFPFFNYTNSSPKFHPLNICRLQFHHFSSKYPLPSFLFPDTRLNYSLFCTNFSRKTTIPRRWIFASIIKSSHIVHKKISSPFPRRWRWSYNFSDRYFSTIKSLYDKFITVPILFRTDVRLLFSFFIKSVTCMKISFNLYSRSF